MSFLIQRLTRNFHKTFRILMVASLLASIVAGLIPPPAVRSLAGLADSVPLSALAETAAGLLPDVSTAHAATDIVAEDANKPLESAQPADVALIAPAPMAHTANEPIPGANTGQIKGTVFQDYNSNGVMNTTGGTTNPAIDVGVAGVTVKAYDASGAQVGSTATSAADGTYTINGVTDGVEYRVEFSNLPSGYESSFHSTTTATASGTSVQFVDGGSGNVSFGINYPADYSQSNPLVAMPFRASGDPQITTGLNQAGAIPWWKAWPYSASDGNTKIAPQAATYAINGLNLGSAWGEAWQRSTKKLYVSAVVQRHIGLGPQGLGGLYQIDFSSGTPVLSNFVDLDAAPFSINFGTLGTNSARGLTGNRMDQTADATAFAAVGKQGIGDVDISEDGKTLYLINLFRQSIIALNVTNGVAPTMYQEYLIVGQPGVPTCTNGTLRPWGLKFYRGKGYLGAVCDGSSAGGTVANMFAYVLSFDPANPAAYTPVLTVPLNYTKGDSAAGFPTAATAWYPWLDTYSDSAFLANNTCASSATQCSLRRPTPILSDIEFDDGGNMILGFADRAGMQIGTEQVRPNGTGYIRYFSGGDLLRACGKPSSGWVLESNGLCAGQAGQNAANQGPGGNEFYQDAEPTSIAPNHQETTLGSLVLFPGRNEIMSSAYDPSKNLFAGGAIRDQNGTGDYIGGFQVYAGQRVTDGNTTGETLGYLGKANGLGDIELLVDPAPLEIGNRVWDDLNGDGVQDPGEPGLPNLAVSLQGPTGTVTINTDAAGHYYFGGLKTHTAYTLTMNVPAGYRLTTPNAQALDGASVASNDAISDTRDSDAALVGGKATIYYTTGAAGQNNHGLDFGFTLLTGGFTISKEIVTTDGNEPAVSGTFQVVASCPDNNGYPARLTLNADGAEVAMGNLISGTVCTFSEDMLTLPSAPDGYVWANAGIHPASITIQADVTATVTAINTLAPQVAQPTNVLTVTKTISGTGSGPFAITVTGPSGVISATTINGGETKLFTGLMSGVYTVTESTPAGWTTVYTATASAGSATGGSSYAVVTLQNTNSATFVTTPITGKVFRDFGSDGLITANGVITDTGVQSVTVTAYDKNGSVVGSAISAATGNYTIDPTGDGPYRVEFTNLPSGYEPTTHGTGNGTSTQFVNTAAGASNVNLGISDPDQCCFGNREIVTSRAIAGDVTNATIGAVDDVIRFPYTYTGHIADAGWPAPTDLTTGAQTGSVWGLAYARQTRTIYASAFVKRFAAMGPGGIGAIYAINRDTGVQSTLIDLASVTALGTIAANSARGLSTLTYLSDVPVYTDTGKIGLGDIELSNDEKTLYAVNLYNKSLMAVNLDANGNAGATTSVNIPNPSCINGDYRPFGLKYWQGNVYVGVVCDASISQSTSDLKAQVYRYDGSTFTPVFATAIPLNYTREQVSPDGTCVPITGWFAWPVGNTPAINSSNCTNGGNEYALYPHPILSDIEFAVDGSMILGFMDRHGNRAGQASSQSGVAVQAVSGGDVLRASPDNALNPTQWTIEPAATSASAEFYGGEEFATQAGTRHYETALGGLALLPGANQVIASVFDPVDDTTGAGNKFRAQGIIRLNNITGIKDAAYSFVERNSPGIFAKGTGAGDVEILCDAAPIEIGNRVWNDLNGDGVQDPGEPALPNLAVSLQGPTGTVTINTDAAGHYYFGGLATNTAYTLTMNVPASYSLTLANEDSVDGTSASSNDAIRDTRDSDAALVGGKATIYYTTGNAGENNHGLDFGFTQPVSGQVDILNIAPVVSLGNRVWYDTNNNGSVDGGEQNVADGVSVELYQDSDSSGGFSVGDTLVTQTVTSGGYYTFTNLVPSSSLATQYLVVISDTNFLAGGLLAGYVNSDGQYADLLDAVGDNHDHGAPINALGQPGGVVASRAISLAVGIQPMGEGNEGHDPIQTSEDSHSNQTIDFGFYQLVLGNRIWDDLNNNGLDDSEPALSSLLTVTATNQSTGDVYTTTTDVNGYYTFTGIISGTYVVSFEAPVGYVSSSIDGNPNAADADDNGVGSSGGLISSAPFVLLPGETIAGVQTVTNNNGSTINPSVDFGVWTPLRLGNRVWLDEDQGDPTSPDKNDGEQDAGEAGVANVQVALLDAAGNPVTSTVTGLPLVTTTDANGYYTFTNLIRGTYKVSVTLPAGYVSSTGANASNTPDDNIDADDNGIGSGVGVGYVQSGLITLQAGTEPTGEDHLGNVDSSSDSNYTVDFGVWRPLNLGNQIWYDTNNDGLLTLGEQGVDAVRVELYRDSNGNGRFDLGDRYVTNTTTVAGGYYTFTNLLRTNTPSQAYLVVITSTNFVANAPLAGYRSSDAGRYETPGIDPDNDVDADDNGITQPALGVVASRPITLTEGSEPNRVELDGDSNFTVDFGFYQLVLGDLVWHDLNNDGIKDGNEPGLDNVSVALLDTAGNLIRTTVTNASGQYTFTNLISGTYVISITPPAGYVSSGGQTLTDGGNNTDHGAPSGNDVVSAPFNLTPGAEPTVDNPTGSSRNPNLDFGLWVPLELGNRVWYDVDNHGDLDATEAGVAGVTLTLLDGAGNPVTSTVTGLPFTTTTNANGYYIFTGIISGTYQVRIDAGNFQVGGVLASYLSSDPTESNPNDNGDSNDNGLNPANPAAYLSDGVVSGLVTLSASDEPINEDDEPAAGIADASSNLSVDFGFVRWDRGDLPDAATATNSPAYSTTLADGGPSHLVIDGLRMGAREDSEADGQPTANASGDDANGLAVDDEDGVSLPIFITGQDGVVTISVVNTTGMTAYVYGFIDFNGDGDFADIGETVNESLPGDGSVTSVALTFTVPLNADISQQLGARFRISSADTLDENGPAPDGEVEDYLIRIAQYDLGDLPTGYPTLLADDGARHAISADLYFGAGVDNEGNGQPANAADGDDQTGNPDDEDGIVFSTPLMPGTSASITLTAHVTPGLTAYYGAFIDFNGDGLFSASEIFTGTIVDGANTLNLTVPGVVSDTVYSRFRIATDPAAISIPTGEAGDGEVEDYALLSLGNQIWFDSGVGNANNALFDGNEQSVPAGVTVTLVVSGTTTPIATTTTDAAGKYLFTGLPAGSYQVIIAAENFQPGGLLVGYGSSTGQDSSDSTDNNDNGADVVNPAVSGIPSNGVTLALGCEPNDDGNGSNSNLTIDFGLVAYEWGDLPDGNASNSPNYVTLNGSNGPSHLLIDGLRIGTTADGELDGQPTATAAGDDSNGPAADDEEGVILPRFIPGQVATVVVNVVNTTDENAWVYGFIDFNGDGDFADAEEMAFGTSDSSGPVLLTFAVPANANTQQMLGARFRLGIAESINLDEPTGPVSSGEVEDYLIQMQPVLGAIGNYVWLDEDADGEQDAGEPGLPNVVVTMVDSHGQPYTTTTDSQGGYLFSDLPQGVYTVTIPASNFTPGGVLVGLEQTPLVGGEQDLGNKDDAGYRIDLSWGEENLTADFGYNPLPANDVNAGTGLAALGDRVWIDSDGDGAQDRNELPVAGVELTLYTDADGNGVYDTPLATAVTNGQGNYLFDNLAAGAYVVRVTNSATASYDVLNPGVYTQTGDPDHFGRSGTNNDNQSTQPVVLAPGDLFLNVDFGYQPQPTVGLNSVGDTVWFDADADGNGPSQAAVDGGAAVTQGAGGNADATDYGLAGVTVSLVKDTNGNGVYDLGEPSIATDVTDANGQYLFTGLADGKYLVRVTDTNNVLADLKPSWDRDNGTNAPDAISAVDLDSAQVVNSSINDRLQDFGYTPNANDQASGLLGDTIWFDSNKDGVQNPGESGIEGVVVTLSDMAGNPVASTTTDENGHYYFAGLPLDEQYNVLVAPENFAPGGALEGMANTGDKEGDKNDTTTSEILTGQNPIDLSNDLGYAASASAPAGRIGNLVWLDANADGLWQGGNGLDGIPSTDDDEPLIGGVTLDLYRDLNGNGKIDAGEPKLASTTTTPTPVTTSGDVGNYLFDNLPVIGNGDGDAAAEYVVDVTDVNGVLAGYWHSLGTPDVTNHSQSDADAVEISTAQPENLTADFGYYVEPAALGNYVWDDTNGNGRQDDGETGLNGVQVKLTVVYANGTSVQMTTVTTNDGSGNAGYYSFGNLLLDEAQNGSGDDAEPVHTITVDVNQAALATYKPTLIDAAGDDKLDADNPAGVVAMPVQGQTDTHAQDPANSEPTIASYDFGFYQPASLGNHVWFDLDKDGVQDNGEPGVAGVKVDLLDKNGALITSTVTSSSGVYTFANLAPGLYSVQFAAPAGYQLTTPEVGDDSKDSDADPATGVTQPVTLVSGENNPTLDAGLQTSLTLGNLVWYDKNNNGQVDAGEPGIAGVTLQLFPAGADPTTATPLATTTTDANGHYTFTNLLPGQYVVYLPTPPLGYTTSSTPTDTTDNGEDNDDNGVQSGFGQPVTSPVITLQANAEPDTDGDGKNGDLTIDFGFFIPASLGDRVWYDANRNGIQDNLETGVSGVVVTLYAADGTQLATMTTDSNGYYRFDNLIPGGYYVEFQPPVGYIASPLNTGADDAFDSDADSTTLLRTPLTTLVSGEHNPTLDLGLSLPDQPAVLGDRVWFDSNHDGVQDGGEANVPGIVVNLYDGEGQLVATTITDANGEYRFPNLDPGAYAVEFILPPDYRFSPQNQGNDGTLNSDVDLSSGRTEPVILLPGETNLGLDVGIYLSPTSLVEEDEPGLRAQLFLPIISNQ